MRDDSQKWALPLPRDFRLDAPGLEIRRVPPVRQVMVSGAGVLKDPAMPPIGWPGIAQGDDYALALRRDRILLVGGPPMAEGWDATTCRSVSDVSDGFAILQVSGAQALAVLRRGSELDLRLASGSVARLMFGLETLLYRYGGQDGYRLHVFPAHVDALLGYLLAAASQSADQPTG